MPFDLGWNFRATAGFVTDGAESVAQVGTAYPHLYTNGNGDSVNAGWLIAETFAEDNANTNDPRIAGDLYVDANAALGFRTFTIDLSSGSAPGAGQYLIDLAMGGAGFGYTASFTVLDDTTPLITGSGTTLAAGHFEDATGANVAATTTWTGTPALKTVASTTVNIVLSAVSYVAIAHFRLTKQEAGSAVAKLKSALMLQGVGA